MRRFPAYLAVSLIALTASAAATEIRQVAPGITMAPGLAEPVKPKKSEAAKVETSKSQKTTYGEPVTPAPPEPPVEAKIEPPKPSQPPLAVNAKPEPDRNAVSRPLAASPKALPQQPEGERSAQKVVSAPESARTARPQPQQAREPRIGDRIPDDARLYPAQRVRVGDRIPNDVPLYDLPRSAFR